MSNVTLILNRFATIVETAITGITRIPNPYDPESSPGIYLKNGYGLAYGSAENATDTLDGCGTIHIRREIMFMQLQEIAKVSTDTLGIKAQLDSMLENELLVIKAIIEDHQLNGGASHVAMAARYTDSDGPDFLVGDKRKFFKTLTAFSVLYREAIS